MAAVKVREVARELSVSPATVSRVLQGSYGTGKVSIGTATRVLRYCHQKGFISKEEKNRILAQMKFQGSDSKIFCLSCLEGLWGYKAIFSSIGGYLQDKGQFLSYIDIRTKQDLVQFPIDQASVMIVLGRISFDTVEYLTKWKTPVVIADYYLPSKNWNTVNSDNLEGMSRAVDILVSKGHRRIAFLCRHEDYPEMTYNLHQRQSGYIVGMANAGLSHDGLIVTSESSEGASVSGGMYNNVVGELRALSDKLLAIKPLPTAVVAANDLTAHVFRMVAQENGLRVPEDVSIIGYDGQHRIPGVNGFNPLSTMVVNYRGMAKALVDLASDLIVEEQQEVRHIIIPTQYEDMGTVSSL